MVGTLLYMPSYPSDHSPLRLCRRVLTPIIANPPVISDDAAVNQFLAITAAAQEAYTYPRHQQPFPSSQSNVASMGPAPQGGGTISSI